MRCPAPTYPAPGLADPGRGSQCRRQRSARADAHRRGVGIFTGAPVPADCDAGVMQERVTRAGDSVGLDRRPQPGENIRRAGDDLAAGAAILPAGRVIGAREAAALAATGLGRVAVRRPVQVAVFSTGSDLRAPGEPLGPGQIWNSNRFQLRAALAAPWVALDDFGTPPDDPVALQAALEWAAATADLVVSTGGVSVGEEDHLPRLLRAAGGDFAVLKVAMKPGKPVALGQLGGAVYIGRPGNPVSVFVTWAVLGARMAEALAGIPAPRPGGRWCGRPPTHPPPGPLRVPPRPADRPGRVRRGGGGVPVALLLAPHRAAGGG